MPAPSPPPPTTLGERLLELRACLGVWTRWSRARVAKEAHLSPHAVARLERGGGTAAGLNALARFYHRQGLNVQWLFAADKQFSSPYSFEERWADEDRHRTFQELADLRAKVQDPLIQARITTLLLQLLPARFSKNQSEVDLWHYQYYLPPVAATTSGWRTRAFNIPPYHYYAAGESVPQCGAPFEYLVYDSPPERPFRAMTCLRCASLAALQ